MLSDGFAPYQFLTYMWMHGGWWHLLSNMFAVFIFGPLLEQMWGSKRFLIFYLATGIGAGILYAGVEFGRTYPEMMAAQEFVENPTPANFDQFVLKDMDPRLRRRNSEMLADLIDNYYDNPSNSQYESQAVGVANDVYAIKKQGTPGMVGASGAVFGILMAFGMLFPNMTLMLLFPPIPIKAKYLVFFYGVYELYSELNRTEGDNVAHLAHLGGMLIAFILLRIWKKQNNNTYY